MKAFYSKSFLIFIIIFYLLGGVLLVLPFIVLLLHDEFLVVLFTIVVLVTLAVSSGDRTAWVVLVTVAALQGRFLDDIALQRPIPLNRMSNK